MGGKAGILRGSSLPGLDRHGGALLALGVPKPEPVVV
jgi:hypothetical protein